MSALPTMFEPQRSANFRFAVGGSIVVHVIAFGFMSPFASRLALRTPDTVLEVELVPAQPQPVAPPAAEPQQPRVQPLPVRHKLLPRVTPPEPPIVRVERPSSPMMTAPSEPRSIVEPSTAIEPVPLVQSPATKPAAVAPGRESAVASLPVFNATYLNNPRPQYPRLARRNGEEGTVILRVLVSQNGMPVRVQMEKSSGSATLDSAAMDAVRSWHFSPARKGNEPFEDWVRVPVVFRLQDAS